MAFFQEIKRRSLEKELSQKRVEQRYTIRTVVKEGEELKESLSRLCRENIQRMSSTLKSMLYFEKSVTSESRKKELQGYAGKVIGTFCNFVPEELIYAAGAVPVRLCAGFYDTISSAEEILPRDVCPLIKSSLGFKIHKLPYFQLCDVVILPTSCDGKKKLGEILNSYLPVWVLELPQSKDLLRAREFWLGEIRILKRKIEEFTGNKISKESLKQAILLLHRRQEVFRRLYEIRRSEPEVISGREVMLVIQTSFFDDVKRWTERVEELCLELQERIELTLPQGDKAFKLLLTGAPVIWPNFKLLNIVEEAGAVIVADELCSGTQHLYDPVEVDEWTMDGMLQAIADRYLLPSTCPCFTSSDDRIDRLLQMIEDFSVDGVIYHSLRLCQLYDIEQAIVKQALRSQGVPMLTIHTDYSGEDVEQIKTRVEAFLEVIKR